MRCESSWLKFRKPSCFVKKGCVYKGVCVDFGIDEGVCLLLEGKMALVGQYVLPVRGFVVWWGVGRVVWTWVILLKVVESLLIVG